MVNTLFQNTKPVTIAIKPRVPRGPKFTVSNETPYDSNSKFNLVVKSYDQDRNGDHYSIDAQAMLDAINSGKVGVLEKITLIARSVDSKGDTFAIWDALLNYSSFRGYTGCIFHAKNDGSPKSINEVAMKQTFLDYTKAVSRIHLNRTRKGDRLVIGLSDKRKGMTYALVYTVKDSTQVKRSIVPGKQGTMATPLLNALELKTSETTLTLPAFNLDLNYILVVNPDGETELANYTDSDEVSQKILDLAGYAVDSADHIETAYPWKPHFLPVIPKSFDHKKIESVDLSEAQDISYEEFESLVRDLYLQAMNEYRQAKRDAMAGVRLRDDDFIPKIGIFKSETHFYASINGILYVVMIDEMGRDAVREIYLLGGDLGNQKPETRNDMIAYGEGGFFRFVTANF